MKQEQPFGFFTDRDVVGKLDIIIGETLTRDA